MPIKDSYLEKIREMQQQDVVCQRLKKYTIAGWPSRNAIPNYVLPFYQYRFEFVHTKSYVKGITNYYSTTTTKGGNRIYS